MRRKISDRTLKRWLETGRPARVAERLASDEALQTRLDVITALNPATLDALSDSVEPADGFDDRTVTGLHERIEAGTALSTLGDILGLGFQVGQLLIAPEDDERKTD